MDFDLVDYGSLENPEDDGRYANDLARRLRDSHFLSGLPDPDDRDLIAHAIAFRCDVFCTRDRRSIHRKRGSLNPVSVHAGYHRGRQMAGARVLARCNH
jgi:hypothetical protein